MKEIKKVLRSLLFSAALCLTAVPALDARAEEITDSVTVEVTAVKDSRASVDTSVKPTTEMNTENLVVNPTAVTIGDKTYVFAKFTDSESASAYFYDQAGRFTCNGSTSSAHAIYLGSSDEERIYYACVDKFTGTKEVTVGVSQVTGGSSQWAAVDIATVTAVEWEGAFESDTLLTASAYNGSVSMQIYLLGSVSASQINLGLYDGETQVGVYEVNSAYSNSSFGVSSLLGYEGYVAIYDSSAEATNAYGSFRTTYKLEGGRNYTVKGTVNGSPVTLGTLYADGTPQVTSAYGSGNFQGNSPVVSVSHYGFTPEQLVVRLLDKDGNAVATSEGGKMQYGGNNGTYFQLATTKSLEELDQTDIAVYGPDGGLLFDDRDFYNSHGIADAYYDHVSNTVVARTYNIPDGTVITASADTPEAENARYTSTAVVSGNMAVFGFTNSSGAPAKLPSGSRSIYFSFTLPEEEFAQNDGDSVRILDESEQDDYSIADMGNQYYYTGQSDYPFEIRISEDYFKDTEGVVYAVLTNSSGNQRGDNIALEPAVETVEGVVVYILRGQLPAGLAADNYTLDFYRGESENVIVGRNIYMMDPSKAYGRIVTSTTYSSDGTRRGVYVESPTEMGYDPALYGISVTDVVGTPVSLDISTRESSVSRRYFYFNGAPENMVNIKVTAAYNGQPIYDISRIKENIQLERTLDPHASYSLTSSTDSMTGMTISFTSRVMDATAYVYQLGIMDPIKEWRLPANERVDLTAEMLEGLQYDNGKEAYRVVAVSTDGSISTRDNVYFGTRRVVTPTNGIFLAEDGNYYLYADGVLCSGYTGLYEANGNFYYVVNGQYMNRYTGLVGNDAGWWYVENGIVNFAYNGLVEYGGAWWCVAGGCVVFDYTGLWSDPTVGWWYVENGTINFNHNGFVEYGGAWWCVAGGRVAFEYTGLWSDPALGWWYVENGAINFAYNGLIEFGGAWWCVAGGGVVFDYTGLWSDPTVGWWYVENGVINFEKNGFIEFGGAWWCVAGGRVAFEYTGLWHDPTVGWWYVENGAINFAYNGLIDCDGTWWCVAGGGVVFDYTGLWSDPEAGWCFVENGTVNFDYNGIEPFNDAWWCVAGGCVAFDYTGLWCDAAGDWWYISNGAVDFGYTGNADHDGSTYYVESGKVIF